jgi:hypothetical protein
VGRRSIVSGARVAAARFYPFGAVKQAGLIRDELDGTPLAVHYSPGVDTPVALVAQLAGERIDLVQHGDGMLEDGATGSVFDVLGRCSSGKYQGKRLELATSVWTRWYGFSQTYPETTIWYA